MVGRLHLDSLHDAIATCSTESASACSPGRGIVNLSRFRATVSLEVRDVVPMEAKVDAQVGEERRFAPQNRDKVESTYVLIH